MYTSTEAEYRDGIAAASDFTGVDDLAAARRASRVRARCGPCGRRSTSSAGPATPLLAWTERPWTYLQWDRIAATRYVWGSFLLGQIYLGAAGPQFVPPHTAEWFAADLARTDPQVFVEQVDNPVPPDSLVGEVVAADFTLRLRRVPVRASAPALRAADDLVDRVVGPAGDGGAGHRSATSSLSRHLSAHRRAPRQPGRVPRRGSSSTTRAATLGERQYLSTAGGEAWSSTDTVELERATWEPPTDRAPCRSRCSSVPTRSPSSSTARCGRPCAPGATCGWRVSSATLRDVTVSPLTLGAGCRG